MSIEFPYVFFRRPVRVIGALLLVASLPAGTASAAEELAWVRQLGSTQSNQFDAARGIAANGGVYIAGATGGTLPGQTVVGGRDAFAAKYDSAGTQLWIRQFGSTSNDVASDVALDTDGIYVVGNVGAILPGQTSAGGTDAYVQKFDGDGNTVWGMQFGSSADDSANGAVGDASAFYVTGLTWGALPGQTSAGDADAFLSKHDLSGNMVWIRQFGSSASDNADEVSVHDGAVYVIGETNGTLPGQTSSGDRDGFLVKYDENGNQVWLRQLGTSGLDQATGVWASSAGVYVSGFVNGTLSGQTGSGGTDAFIRKYDHAGDVVWTRQFGTTEADVAQELIGDATGVYLVGGTEGAFPDQTSAGDKDVFVRRYAHNGNPIWTHQFGTSAQDDQSGIALGPCHVFVSGTTEGGEFPGQTSRGAQDAFTAAIGNFEIVYHSGNPVTITGFGQPYDVFVPSDLLLDATCAGTSARLEVGKGHLLQYIWHTAYEARNNEWQPFEITGDDLLGGLWWRGEASADRPWTTTEQAQTNYVIAYVCTWTGTEFKCGCRDAACTQSFWQLQAYQRKTQ